MLGIGIGAATLNPGAGGDNPRGGGPVASKLGPGLWWARQVVIAASSRDTLRADCREAEALTGDGHGV